MCLIREQPSPLLVPVCIDTICLPFLCAFQMSLQIWLSVLHSRKCEISVWGCPVCTGRNLKTWLVALMRLLESNLVIIMHSVGCCTQRTLACLNGWYNCLWLYTCFLESFSDWNCKVIHDGVETSETAQSCWEQCLHFHWRVIMWLLVRAFESLFFHLEVKYDVMIKAYKLWSFIMKLHPNVRIC